MQSGLRFRLATPADGASIASIYRPYVTDAATSFEIEAPSPDEMARRIAAGLLLAPWLVCVDGHDQVVGYAYAGRHRERAAYQWSCDVTVYIHADHHRRGIGRALYDRLLG